MRAADAVLRPAGQAQAAGVGTHIVVGALLAAAVVATGVVVAHQCDRVARAAARAGCAPRRPRRGR